MRRALPFLAVIGFALSACTLSPFYHRPALPVPDQWPGVSASSSTAIAADIGWRDFFKDPQLQLLIALALTNNRDLRIAILNVEAARAQYHIQRADLLPTVNASASEVAQRQPNFYNFPNYPTTTHQYAVGLGFTSYEFDLFGRIRSQNKSAFERYVSAAETRRGAHITLVSEVAVQYLTLLADQELLRLTKDTLTDQQAAFDLTQQRASAGIANDLDVSQARTAVEAARANLAQYTRQAQQDANALAFLIGEPLPAGIAPAGGTFNDEQVLAPIPEGLPSDMLVRRPDILAAEHNLIAANADIGAARAAFFPSISLTGNFGTASAQLDGLFKTGSRAWVFNPKISLPIFAAGANAAGLKLANVGKKIEVAQYEKAIQGAFREVSDALVGRSTLEDQVNAQAALVQASSDSYRLSDMRFRAGIDDYLTVIVSQRALYAAQQNLVSVKLLRLENEITLYKALGGGWNETTPKSGKPAEPQTVITPSSGTASSPH